MKIIFLLFFSFISLSANAQLPSPWPQQMSADQAIHIPNGPSITSKLYLDNGKVRADINTGTMQMSSVILMDKKIMYTIMPAQKMVVEIPMTPKEVDNYMAYNPQALKFDVVGSEILNGVACDKYRLNYSSGKPMIFWINKQTRAPMQMEAEDKTMKIEWSNVVIGPQPASLYEIPAGYQVMKSPIGTH